MSQAGDFMNVKLATLFNCNCREMGLDRRVYMEMCLMVLKKSLEFN